MNARIHVDMTLGVLSEAHGDSVKPDPGVRFKVMRRMLAIRKSMGGLANGGGETQ
jgi:hypothetical protein